MPAEKPADKEFVVKIKERISVCGCDTDLIQESPYEVMVYMPNGGHVRLVSKEPIMVFMKPE